MLTDCARSHVKITRYDHANAKLEVVHLTRQNRMTKTNQHKGEDGMMNTQDYN
jgi:hypothetical protein